jgi:hypothetical protein
VRFAQYPEFRVSSASIQDALADVAQAEAGRARSSNTKGLVMNSPSLCGVNDLGLGGASLAPVYPDIHFCSTAVEA